MKQGHGARGLVASVALLASACGRSDPSSVPMAVSASAPPPAAALPPDHTEQGELAEGTVRAGGVLLPRGFSVARAFEGETHARGSEAPERVANYLRRRLDAASIEVGASRTIFTGAHAKGQAGPLLRIEVSDAGGSTEIAIFEARQAPVDPTLSEEERWRRAGLKPSGQLLDPTKAFLELSDAGVHLR